QRPRHGEKDGAGAWRDALHAVRDARTRPLAGYLLAWNAAVGISAGFFSFHMLANLRMAFMLVAAHAIIVAAVRVASAGAWGRLVDGCGARPVLVVCSRRCWRARCTRPARRGARCTCCSCSRRSAEAPRPCWPCGSTSPPRAPWPSSRARRSAWSVVAPRLVQPVFLLELARQIALGQVLEVLVRERVQLVLQPAREHPLDLFLPGLLREPRVAQQLARARDVLVVELDADVARQAVRLGIRARE